MTKVKPKIGDREECPEFADMRMNLIRFYSERIRAADWSGRDYQRMYSAAQSLAYQYSLITCVKEPHIPSNATPQEMLTFFWRMTPPFYEMTGFYHNGDPRWQGMHSNNLKEYFYD